MEFSVADLLNRYAPDVRLLAGREGLTRGVEEVTILDYELMPGIKSRYRLANFGSGDFVLSTFLYAREAPYLITEAVKYLVERNASGLMIKNVLHLPIPDAALRYAEVRGFPVLACTSDQLFFDRIIVDVEERIATRGDDDRLEAAVAALMSVEPGTLEAEEYARAVDPSFGDMVGACFVPLGASARKRYVDVREQIARRLPNGVTLARYRDGALLIASADRSEAVDLARFGSLLLERAPEGHGTMGIGDATHPVAEARTAIEQALIASALGEALHTGETCEFGSLGMLRAVAGVADRPSLRAYATWVLGPVREFDSEHAAQLHRTLRTFWIEHGSVASTAAALGAHPNTVRYRLDQVAALTGLDYRRLGSMEELGLALAVELCCEALAH